MPEEIHRYIQTTDLNTIETTPEDGESLLLLNVLDLGHWSKIFELANSDTPAALARLEDAANRLHDLNQRDALDLEEARFNTGLVETYLKQTNFGGRFQGSTMEHKPAADASAAHPFVIHMRVPEAHKAALEDLRESISATQTERERATLSNSSENFSIPFMPPRAVEELVAEKCHRVWTIPNLNLLAPISTSVWRIWTGLSEDDMRTCSESAEQNRSAFRGKHKLLHPFSLSLFDHRKCQTEEVSILLKNELNTKEREPTYLKELWNVGRPYMRCLCERKATQGCTGEILWWDHAIWFLANNLEKFFPDELYPSLTTKFVAFMYWMRDAGKMAVMGHLMFLHTRHWMMQSSVLLAADPEASIPSRFKDLPGYRKVERLFKPPSFSINQTSSPSPAPPHKRGRFNLNVTSPGPPAQSHPRNRQGGYAGRGRGRSTGYRRGTNMAYQSRPAPTTGVHSPITPRDKVPAFGGHNGGQQPAEPLGHARPPITGRILSFEDDF
jgi:hypothetical protein